MEGLQIIRDDGQRGTVLQRLAPAEAAPQLVIAFDGVAAILSGPKARRHYPGLCTAL
jgi:hypothetical protein